eukprot:gene3290-3773_t
MSEGAEFYLTIIGMCVFIFIAIFGNVITIIATFRFESLQTKTHILIANLAVSDILIASLAAPLRLVELSGSTWSKQVSNCRIIITLTSFFCNASVLNLTLISIDRAHSIVSPLTYNHGSHPMKLVGQIICSWLLAVVISFLPFAGYGWKDGSITAANSTVAVCRYLSVLDKYYVLFVFGSAVFGPFLIMVVAYMYIFRVAIRHLQRISAVEISIRRTVSESKNTENLVGRGETETSAAMHVGQGNLHARRRRTKPSTYRAHLFMKELKAAKMIAIVIGLFILFVVPIVLVDIAEIACGYPCAPKWCVTLGVHLSYLNPVANIFAYATMSTDYRKAYQRILKSLFCCGGNTM